VNDNHLTVAAEHNIQFDHDSPGFYGSFKSRRGILGIFGVIPPVANDPGSIKIFV
jgi:hypothetical protein